MAHSTWLEPSSFNGWQGMLAPMPDRDQVTVRSSLQAITQTETFCIAS